MTAAPSSLPHRADARTTALGALVIFLPLVAGLLWWAFAHAMAGLPALWAVLAALLAAAGPAVLLAELLANVSRLHVVFHFHKSRVVHAALLGLATPVAVIHGFPTLAGPTALIWLFGGLGAGFSFSESFEGILALLVVVPLAALAWYPIVCLLASGIPDHRRRFAIFALLWWSLYGALALFGVWLIPMALV